MFWRKPKPQAPAMFHDRLPVHDAADVDRMLKAMDSDGFVLIKAVAPPPYVVTAKQKSNELVPLQWDFTGPPDHYKNVFNRHPFWLSFIDRAGVTDVAEAALGGDCHIIGQTAWRSHPGHYGVGLHLDFLPMEWPEPGVPDAVRVPMFLCTAHFYLSPQPAELCPTLVMPRTPRAARAPRGAGGRGGRTRIGAAGCRSRCCVTPGTCCSSAAISGTAVATTGPPTRSDTYCRSTTGAARWPSILRHI